MQVTAVIRSTRDMPANLPISDDDAQADYPSCPNLSVKLFRDRYVFVFRVRTFNRRVREPVPAAV
jgi:hypothetical protein